MAYSIQTGEEFFFKIIIGLNYRISHRCCQMFLLNFDITIVVDFSHKIDFIETEQTEKKVKFAETAIRHECKNICVTQFSRYLFSVRSYTVN